jgi:hypothetical protein
VGHLLLGGHGVVGTELDALADSRRVQLGQKLRQSSDDLGLEVGYAPVFNVKFRAEQVNRSKKGRGVLALGHLGLKHGHNVHAHDTLHRGKTLGGILLLRESEHNGAQNGEGARNNSDLHEILL